VFTPLTPDCKSGGLAAGLQIQLEQIQTLNHLEEGGIMSIDISALATSIVAVLAPYLAKGASKFAEEFGKDAYEKAEALLAALRRRLAGKPQGEQALANCETAPTPENQTALAQVVKGELVAEPEGVAFAAEVIPLVEALTPLLRSAAATAGGQFMISADTIGAVGPHAQATIHITEQPRQRKRRKE
jgi:hypothetical protein